MGRSARNADSQLKVLLAEDNAVSRHLVATFLTDKGYHVTVAHNGSEAVDLARENEFDLIIMDLLMPEMDGYEAAREIRGEEMRSRKHAPVVALTADDSLDVKERCRQHGIDAVLMKPVRSSEFFAVVESLLN